MNPKSAIDPEDLLAAGYQIQFVSHAKAIIEVDFPQAWIDLQESLLGLRIPIEEIIGSGGGEAKGTQRLRKSLAERNWIKTTFKIEKRINEIPKESISHEVDHAKAFDGQGMIALEIEWNNKDPFFDRDLENFKRLHAEGAISVGVIVTRGAGLQDEMRNLVTRFVVERKIEGFKNLEQYGYVPTYRQKRAITVLTERSRKPLPFQEAFIGNFVNNKYGTATTHWRKLDDRIKRGVGNPCPLVLIGLPKSIVTFDEKPEVVRALLEEAQAEASGDLGNEDG